MRGSRTGQREPENGAHYILQRGDRTNRCHSHLDTNRWRSEAIGDDERKWILGGEPSTAEKATPRWYSSGNAGSGHPSSAMAMTTQVDDNSVRSRRASASAQHRSQQHTERFWSLIYLFPRILGMQLDTTRKDHVFSTGKHRNTNMLRTFPSMKMKLRPHGLLQSCQIRARQKSP